MKAMKANEGIKIVTDWMLFSGGVDANEGMKAIYRRFMYAPAYVYCVCVILIECLHAFISLTVLRIINRLTDLLSESPCLHCPSLPSLEVCR
jgi:hypothetical protein